MRLFALLLIAVPAFAQFGPATNVAPVTALPPCDPPQGAVRALTTGGSQGLYSCTGHNTWTYIGGGAMGPSGPTGPAGATGPSGPAGATGAASTVPGPSGPSGPAGVAGPSGPSGAAGVAGASGPSGPAGAAGPSGATGVAGPSGPSGPAGGGGTGVVLCAPASASGTHYTCTPSPALGAYAAGTTLAFIPDVAGTAGAIDVAVSGLAAKSITIGDTGNTNPVGSTFVAGSVYILTYDGTRFRYSPAQFDPTKSGSVYMTGITSGGVALSVGDIAGTAITYVEPTTNGTADQVLFDSGATTCPTLPVGFPTTCHLKVWTSVTNCGDTTHALAYSTSSHVFSCQAITGSGGSGGVNAQTVTYTLVSGDSGKLVTMNGSSITANLPASPPSATWYVAIQNLNASALTVSRNGLNINGGTSNITLQQYQWTYCYTDNSNYFCKPPVAAGANVTLTMSTVAETIASSAGGTGFVACHAYTYTSGTLTVDFSTYSCAIVTASGANPTLAFTAPTSSIATPLTLGLCNDATARVWTLPGTAKQFGVPFTLSTCVYNSAIVFDGTNYQAPGSTDTASILGLSAERAAPTVVPAGGAIYPNSTSHNLHYLNSSVTDFAMFLKLGADCNPDTGVCLKTNGVSFTALATTAPGTGVATFLATPSGANFNSMIAPGGVPITQNSQSTAYTLVLSDGGGSVLHPTADNNARTFTIPANSSVAYPIGTVITFINQINTVTIAITTDTLQLAGTATIGSRTLAVGGIATAVKVTSTLWFISGPGLT